MLLGDSSFIDIIIFITMNMVVGGMSGIIVTLIYMRKK